MAGGHADEITPQRSLKAKQVELVLHGIDGLPTLSPVATKLLAMSSDEDVDLGEIGRVLESDPALTAMILQLLRETDRASAENITSVKQAVVLLGLEAVQSAVLSVQVYELMSDQGAELDRLGKTNTGKGEWFDRVGVWKHAAGVACASELIAQSFPQLGVRRDAAFVSGLLHDLGKLALELVLPEAYGRVLRLAERRQSDSASIEREVIGIDHHTAGRRLAEKWGLPAPLRDVIWLHGQPFDTLPEIAHAPIVKLVTLARRWSRQQHLGWSGDFSDPGDVTAMAESMGLDGGVFQAMTPNLVERVSERYQLLGLDNATAPELLVRSISDANRRLSALNRSLHARAMLARQQKTVLDAIGSFQASWDPTRTVVETLDQIVRSASGLIGPGFYGAVFQPTPSDPWQIYQFGPKGRLLRAQVADGPGEISGGSLAALTDTSRLSVGALAALPWLTDYLGDSADLRQVRLLTLMTTSDSGGPSVLLLHDRDPESAGIDAGPLEAIRAAWASAVLASSRHDEARWLGERLAESNRSLAEAQARLTEHEAMVKLGEMSAGAAHEMNNPLTVIRGRSQLLAQWVSGEKEKSAALAISSAAEHLSELITSLHLLADPPEPELRSEKLVDVLEDALSAARERVSDIGAAKVVVEDESCAVLVDRGLIIQSFSEVIANAMESGEGVEVHVSGQYDETEDRVVVRVRDTGRGLSDRAFRHAFDPFFSEKPAGRQAGLGLARARRLIELHGGEITLERSAEGGTVATVRLHTDATRGSIAGGETPSNGHGEWGSGRAA